MGTNFDFYQAADPEAKGRSWSTWLVVPSGTLVVPRTFSMTWTQRTWRLFAGINNWQFGEAA